MDSEITSIYKLHESSARPLALFVGSGLSVPEPTSLPLNTEVIASLLNLDWVDGPEKFPIPESQAARSNLYMIRFEHALSIFREWGKHDLGELLQQFAQAPSNWYHQRIAELCDMHIVRSIVTTNFDLCLEKALADKRVRHNVVVTEDDQLSCENDVVNVFKVHGTVEVRDGRYCTRGLIATLESMYRGLETWKQAVLQRLLDQYALVFLGYGGFDSYDINPFLYGQQNSHLFWVVHRTGETQNVTPPEVSKILDGSPYPVPLQIDTAIFLGGDPLPARTGAFRFTPSYELDKHWHPSGFVGRVLEASGDWEGAEDYYRAVLDGSTGERYWMVEILNLMRALAAAQYELEKYEEANGQLLMSMALLLGYKARMDSAPAMSEDLKRYIWLDQSLLLYEERALVGSRLGRWAEADEQMKQAFECLSALDFRDEYTRLCTESRLLLNRGSMGRQHSLSQEHGDPAESLLAIEDLEKACSIKRRVGDVIGLIKGLANLSLLYMLLGDARSESFLLEMFSEAQRLRTPLEEKLIEPALTMLGVFTCSRLDEHPDEKLVAFALHQKGGIALQIRRRIHEILTTQVFRDAWEAVSALSRDEKIRLSWNELREEFHHGTERRT